VLVEPEDADALAAGILRVIDDEELAAHLAEEGLVDSREYEPEAVAEQYVAFFRQVLGQPAAAPAGRQTRLTPSS
jgi:glycosyltransferase involved in cell wall biosynthesis